MELPVYTAAYPLSYTKGGNTPIFHFYNWLPIEEELLLI